MSREEEVKAIVALIKSNKNNWRISHRAKNYSAAVTLGIDLDEILDAIYQKITWHNFVAGPMADNHHPRIPGDIWLFGMDIENTEYYLKFQNVFGYFDIRFDFS